MYGLIEVDLTEPRQLMADAGTDLSLTAYVVASVAQAASTHPNVHAYRDWRGRLITHSHVDVTTMVEVGTSQGKFPLAVVVEDADIRSVATITNQLRNAKAAPRESGNGRFLTAAAMGLTRIPYLATSLFRFGSHSVRARQRMGTVSVTAIGMFGAGPGYGFGGATVYSLGIVVGGISRQPMVREGTIVEREVLNLTVTVDHNMVDGGPAARFVGDLRQAIESGAALHG